MYYISAGQTNLLQVVENVFIALAYEQLWPNLGHQLMYRMTSFISKFQAFKIYENLKKQLFCSCLSETDMIELKKWSWHLICFNVPLREL